MKRLRKTTKDLRITDFLAEIQTEHHPDTSPMSCRCTISVGLQEIEKNWYAKEEEIGAFLSIHVEWKECYAYYT
jgi:hypothetical protein